MKASSLANVILLLVWISVPAQSQEIEFEYDSHGFNTLIEPFFEEYCQRCHGEEEQKGNLRVDLLGPDDFDSAARASRWAEILDAVNGYQMPPDDEKQPAAERAGVFADWVLAQLAAGEIARQESHFVLRRLNRDEYNNTIRDLFSMDMRPADEFPEDGSAFGFDNVGSALTVSPLLMELYLNAAREVVDRAIVDSRRSPQQVQWRFDPEENQVGVDAYRVNQDGQRVLLNHGNNETDDDWTRVRRYSWDTDIGFRDFRVPYSGDYIIRIRAFGDSPGRDEVLASVSAIQGANSRSLRHFQEDRMYDYGPPRVRVIKSLGGQPERVAVIDVDAAADEPGIYELRTRFTTDTAGVRLEYAYDIPETLENSSIQFDEEFARPAYSIDWIELEGPVYESWPPASHRAVLPENSFGRRNEDAYVEASLQEFMRRAYRRPVTESEVESKFDLYKDGRERGESLEEAIKQSLVAILTSPNFLFMIESGVEDTDGRLSPYELATRLSYFLWSSMPDETLFELAENGTLSNREVLQAQVDRLLANSKSEAFVRNFAGQWLGLREVGANPPGNTLFPRYDSHLQTSIVAESEAFFSEILHRDLDVRNFIRSDFVTINERLARYYGIPDIRGNEFRVVPVPEGSHRGGLVTQASMLTTTSNGTRTSPVDRGVWVLRTMLGQDPGLPVSNVGEIAPNVPGIDKATVRQRLELHRSFPQCARCHNRIDPLGLALENFDASGSWRDREGFGYNGRIQSNDPIIDASAQMPDGTAIVGVDGLQEALLEQQNQFFMTLTEKLFVYALGRPIGHADRQTVRNIVQQAGTEHLTLRNLIYAIVTADQFQTR